MIYWGLLYFPPFDPIVDRPLLGMHRLRAAARGPGFPVRKGERYRVMPYQLPSSCCCVSGFWVGVFPPRQVLAHFFLSSIQSFRLGSVRGRGGRRGHTPFHLSFLFGRHMVARIITNVLNRRLRCLAAGLPLWRLAGYSRAKYNSDCPS